MSMYQTITAEDVDVDCYSAVFAALANPNRLRLFLRIIECCGRGDVCQTDEDIGAAVGELAEGLGLAPSTVSHHLKELRQAGLILMVRDGRTINCSANWASLEDLLALFKHVGALQS